MRYILSRNQPTRFDLLGDFLLARYAVKYWMAHTRKAGHSGDVLRLLILKLILDRPKSFINSIRLFDPERPFDRLNIIRSRDSISPALYHTSWTGAICIMRILFSAQLDVNT